MILLCCLTACAPATDREVRGSQLASTGKVVEETSDSLNVLAHLRQAASDCSWLCLWLDCDREGENICYEVLTVLGKQFGDAPDRVARARFSATTESEVRGALHRLSVPNAAEAAAVDVRQHLDLKVGVSFTRLLTRALRDAARKRFALPGLRLISYGPCQTPTLGFVVERQREIRAFVPRQFWTLEARCSARSPDGP